MINANSITPWLKDPGGSMPLSQGSPIIPMLYQTKPFLVLTHISLKYILTLSSFLRLGFPRSILPVGYLLKF